uniref:Uncharacterized protein n=1 Tax=Ditylenchus dipsaci TaxID=166011 RepID=A0A915DQG2_9BILA
MDPLVLASGTPCFWRVGPSGSAEWTPLLLASGTPLVLPSGTPLVLASGPLGSGEWDPFGSGEWDPFGSGEYGQRISYWKGKIMGFCNGYTMSFRQVRQHDGNRTRNPLTRITGGVRSQRAIFSGNQIQQLVANYRNGTGLPRIEFLVSIAAHLEKYQGH